MKKSKAVSGTEEPAGKRTSEDRVYHPHRTGRTIQDGGDGAGHPKEVRTAAHPREPQDTTKDRRPQEAVLPAPTAGRTEGPSRGAEPHTPSCRLDGHKLSPSAGGDRLS